MADTQNQAAQVVHEVYYGAHKKHVGWVEEGTMLATFQRKFAEAIGTGHPAWLEIFSNGKGVTSVLAAPGIPVFTRAVVYNNPIE